MQFGCKKLGGKGVGGGGLIQTFSLMKGGGVSLLKRKGFLEREGLVKNYLNALYVT